MRLVIAPGVLFLAGCASSPTDSTAAIDRTCTFTDCFAERDVRDFEVIDVSTLVVFVGQQRCAFRVELRGALCDMTFATDVFFTKPGEGTIAPTGTRNASRPMDPFETEVLADDDLRVCSSDLQINVDGGAFAETSGVGGPRAQCQLSSVKSLTDDQLLELYVERGISPPPPPLGAGEIEVGEQDATPPVAEPAASEGAGTSVPLRGDVAASTQTAAARSN